MKPDEIAFLKLIAQECVFPRELIEKLDFPLHPKRAHYLLKKWTDKGWYQYGVCLDLGWLTDEGKKHAGSNQGSV